MVGLCLTYCYLVASSLEKLQQSYAVELIWHSFELRPPGSPPISSEMRQYIENARPRMEAMAREQYGITMNAGPFGINSRPALIGEHYARQHNVGNAYHDAVMHAYWRDAGNIEDRNLLANIASKVGLDPQAFLAALDDPTWNSAVEVDVAQAHTFGLTGVPALIFAQRYLVVGAQPLATLRNVMDRLV